jgi:hypothetical protein
MGHVRAHSLHTKIAKDLRADAKQARIGFEPVQFRAFLASGFWQQGQEVIG